MSSKRKGIRGIQLISMILIAILFGLIHINEPMPIHLSILIMSIAVALAGFVIIAERRYVRYMVRTYNLEPINNASRFECTINCSIIFLTVSFIVSMFFSQADVVPISIFTIFFLLSVLYMTSPKVYINDFMIVINDEFIYFSRIVGVEVIMKKIIKVTLDNDEKYFLIHSNEIKKKAVCIMDDYSKIIE